MDQAMSIHKPLASAGTIVLLLLTLLIACDQLPEPFIYEFEYPDEDPGEYRPRSKAAANACKVLFIGNSLTYFSNQPQMLRVLAERDSLRIFVDESTLPGGQLEHHCGYWKTQRKIDEQDWDFVILQEAVPELNSTVTHPKILPYVDTLKTWIHRNNPDTRIIYFMPYALKSGSSWEFITLSYQEAQLNLCDGTVEFIKTAGVMTAPVGKAWGTTRKERPDIELYYQDGAHPSYLGTYLGACVYYVTIFQQSVIGNSWEVWSGATEYLQTVATETVLNNLEFWNIPALSDSLTEYWQIKPLSPIEGDPNPDDSTAINLN
jgi:hypothetical protein